MTSIGNSAFEGCPSLRYNEYSNAYYLGNDENPCVLLVKSKSKDIATCEINEKCRIIYHYAFSNCSDLSSVSIPESVTSIGSYAFDSCTNLISVSIPNSVTSIGTDAFYDCCSLQYNEYDEALYLGNDENPCVVLIKSKSEDIIACEINEKCRIIYSYAFCGCCNLTSVTIPNSVSSIGSYAFYGCCNLPSVTIGNGVTSIGSYAFSECINLTSVSIPNRPPSLLAMV